MDQIYTLIVYHLPRLYNGGLIAVGASPAIEASIEVTISRPSVQMVVGVRSGRDQNTAVGPTAFRH